MIRLFYKLTLILITSIFLFSFSEEINAAENQVDNDRVIVSDKEYSLKDNSITIVSVDKSYPKDGMSLVVAFSDGRTYEAIYLNKTTFFEKPTFWDINLGSMIPVNSTSKIPHIAQKGMAFSLDEISLIINAAIEYIEQTEPHPIRKIYLGYTFDEEFWELAQSIAINELSSLKGVIKVKESEKHLYFERHLENSDFIDKLCEVSFSKLFKCADSNRFSSYNSFDISLRGKEWSALKAHYTAGINPISDFSIRSYAPE